MEHKEKKKMRHETKLPKVCNNSEDRINNSELHNMREKILTESMKLFLRKGFRGTSMRDIADAVNLSKGSLYWHFKSKDDILNTIIDYHDHIFVDRVIEAVRKLKGNFIQKLKYSHKWITEFAYNNKVLSIGYSTIAGEMVGSGTEAESKIMRSYQKYHRFWRELLETGKKEAKIRDNMDIELVAHVIIAIHQGILLSWYMNRDIDAPKLSVTYRDLMLLGMIKEERKLKERSHV